EDGIRDKLVTGVQTCALPIFGRIGDKGQPDFRSRYAQPVRFRLSCEDVSKIRIEASSKGHKRAERAGNVEIKNLLDYTHGPFDGRVIESEVPGDGNQNEKDGRLERTFHQSRLP